MLKDNNLFFKKTLFVLFIFFMFRLGSYISIPSVNTALIEPYLNSFNSELLTLINTFSGGSASRFSILMLGIMPFVTATIFVQMLSLFIPKLKSLRESGEKGQIQLNRYTKYLTFFIALFQSFIVSTKILEASYQGISLVTTDILSFYITSTISLIGGTFITVWMAEKINEYGYGSGITMMIFCGIISSIPQNISIIKNTAEFQTTNIGLIAFLLMIFGLFFLISYIENARRNIKIITPDAREGESNYPIKINVASIMPAIFAFMLVSVPQMIIGNLEQIGNFSLSVLWDNYFGYSKFFFFLFICSLIFIFSFIYGKILFNTKKLSESFRDNNIMVKGIRPNRPTENYLSSIRSKLIFISASYLSLIVVLPEVFNYITGFYFYLGGISILIIVNVSMDVKNSFEANKNKALISQAEKYNKEIIGD
tara:strand:- start:235 stop:1509 length:1275 start_codon:yes stop_codon:yes gene_type:complete